MMDTEVAQAGTSSNTHISVAYTKMAMIRCWTAVRPSMPKDSVGRNQRTRTMMATKMRPRLFFLRREGLNRFF